MDQTDELGSGPGLSRWWRRGLAAVLLCAVLPAWAEDAPRDWRTTLHDRLAAVDAALPGELGVYVKNLDTGEALSFRGGERWYLASGVKLPVAIAVLRAVERGELTLASTVALEVADYVDGAGETNWQPPGARLRIRYLFEQMLIHSDNTATDMLIRVVGLDRVNRVARELMAEGVHITTLVDVRRHVYGALHLDAFGLSGMDFIALRKLDDEDRRVARLARLIGISKRELRMDDLDSAFAAYYATRLNSARLSAFARLLEKLVAGEALSPEHTAYLLNVMRRVETGKQRIRAGLPDAVSFAHKTGTQHRRACDFGIATAARDDARRVVIAACTRGVLSVARSERALRAVGEAVTASGLLGSR